MSVKRSQACAYQAGGPPENSAVTTLTFVNLENTGTATFQNTPQLTTIHWGALRTIGALVGHPEPAIHQPALLLLATLTTEDVDPMADETKRHIKREGIFELLVPHLFATVPLTVAFACAAVQNTVADFTLSKYLEEVGGVARLRELAHCDLEESRLIKEEAERNEAAQAASMDAARQAAYAARAAAKAEKAAHDAMAVAEAEKDSEFAMKAATIAKHSAEKANDCARHTASCAWRTAVAMVIASKHMAHDGERTHAIAAAALAARAKKLDASARSARVAAEISCLTAEEEYIRAECAASASRAITDVIEIIADESIELETKLLKAREHDSELDID